MKEGTVSQGKDTIKFIIDMDRFTITFIFSEKNLLRTIKEGFKRKLSADEINKRMSTNMTDACAWAIEKVAKITKIDVNLYTPIIKMEA